MVVLVIGGYAVVSIETQRDQLMQEVIRSTNQVSEAIKRSLRYDMLKYQPERLHRSIDTIGAQEGIIKVRIFNNMGKIIYSSQKTEIGAILDASAEQCYACHAREKPFAHLASSERTRIFETETGHRVMGMINPIHNEPDCYSAACHIHSRERKVLGVMDIDVSLSEVDSVIASSKKKMIVFAVVAIVGISVIIGVFIQRFVSRPVRELLGGIERVGAGDLGTPIDVSSDDEIGVVARSFNQMTERVRNSEQALKVSEHKYRSLFDNDPNPIFLFDRFTLRIIDANIRATEKYGYSKEELMNMNFPDLGDQQDVEKVRSSLVEACTFLPKVRHCKKDGSVIHVNIHSCPWEHLGEQVIIANVADISERIKAEAQLIQAGKMATLGEMSTGVAHELNQPLNAIKVGSEFLLTMTEQGKPIPDDELEEVAREINEQIDRAAGIINHLREFGRKSDITKEAIDINRPIRGVFTLLGQQLKIRGIEVIVDLDEALPPILADENRIEQVMVNLVNNARDAMEAKTRLGVPGDANILTVRSSLEDDQVVVSVSDTGVGIPEALRERIFEPFFTTKEVGKGTGLGLSISYGIVRDYDGSIDLETEQGVGTTFRVSFPKASQERENGPG
ncbi:MAG: sensor histidine kinase [Syntrophobacteria bacterium]